MPVPCRCHGQRPPLEREAFADWVEHLAGQMARRYPAGDYDDVKQAMWWGAVRAFDVYVPRPGGDLLPFVVQRMRWAAVDHYRGGAEFGRGNGSAVPVGVLVVFDTPVQDERLDAVEDAALATWAVREAGRAFEALPVKAALVARRRYWDGASNAVIAAELGVSESRVAQLSKPARDALAALRG